LITPRPQPLRVGGDICCPISRCVLFDQTADFCGFRRSSQAILSFDLVRSQPARFGCGYVPLMVITRIPQAFIQHVGLSFRPDLDESKWLRTLGRSTWWTGNIEPDPRRADLFRGRPQSPSTPKHVAHRIDRRGVPQGARAPASPPVADDAPLPYPSDLRGIDPEAPAGFCANSRHPAA